MWRSKVILQPGESLEHKRSSSKGFMGETEVDEYDVLDTNGKIVGKVVYTEHTAVKGFHRTQTVRQIDMEGRVLRDTNWSGD